MKKLVIVLGLASISLQASDTYFKKQSVGKFLGIFLLALSDPVMADNCTN